MSKKREGVVELSAVPVNWINTVKMRGEDLEKLEIMPGGIIEIIGRRGTLLVKAVEDDYLPPAKIGIDARTMKLFGIRRTEDVSAARYTGPPLEVEEEEEEE
jgi:formylmethanofuran dehydrogenase subunit D